MAADPKPYSLLERRAGLAAGALLAVHATLLGYAARVHSPVIDEPAHLVAGLSHLEFGRFDLFRANPPLVRMLAAIPVWFAGAQTNWGQYSAGPGSRAEFGVARDFMVSNADILFQKFALARWACVPLGVLGGCVCWLWARGLYGPWAGLAALTLWCTCPNILGNACLITPDAGATALGVAAMWLFWMWLREPRWEWAFTAGVGLGLAELTKMTWSVLLALWPALWIAYRAVKKPAGSSDTGRAFAPRWHPAREGVQLAAILTLGLVILNLGYGFEGSFTPLDRYRFVSGALTGTSPAPKTDGNRFIGTWAGKLPVPLPRNYVMGLDTVKDAFEMNRPAYLGGEFRNGGWWYYYLYALAIKIPLGTYLLGMVAFGTAFARHGCRASLRDTLILLAPAAAVLALVSANSGINRHLRYALPAFPFAFIWASQAVQAAAAPSAGASGTILRVCVWGALAWSVGSSMRVYPHSGSYFNELAGGPTGGHAHLINSNIDWGQDLLFLRDWCRIHPDVHPLHLAYYGPVDPAIAGIQYTLPPPGRESHDDDPSAERIVRGPVAGWHAVSVNLLRGGPADISDGAGGRRWAALGEYAYFQKFKPIAMAGYSIYIYFITAEDADRARLELGLPPLSNNDQTR